MTKGQSELDDLSLAGVARHAAEVDHLTGAVQLHLKQRTIHWYTHGTHKGHSRGHVVHTRYTQGTQSWTRGTHTVHTRDTVVDTLVRTRYTQGTQSWTRGTHTVHTRDTVMDTWYTHGTHKGHSRGHMVHTRYIVWTHGTHGTHKGHSRGHMVHIDTQDKHIDAQFVFLFLYGRHKQRSYDKSISLLCAFIYFYKGIYLKYCTPDH